MVTIQSLIREYWKIWDNHWPFLTKYLAISRRSYTNSAISNAKKKIPFTNPPISSLAACSGPHGIQNSPNISQNLLSFSHYSPNASVVNAGFKVILNMFFVLLSPVNIHFCHIFEILFLKKEKNCFFFRKITSLKKQISELFFFW